MNTYWNGELTPAVRGTAVVADSTDFPLYWAREEGLVGNRIPVVWVKYNGTEFYLDDRGDKGWIKITEGKGSPRFSHANVVIEHDSFEARR